MFDSLGRMPFVDSAELAGILGEAHATVHRALTGMLAAGILGRVSHGTAHLPSSQRYYLTAKGIKQAAELLGFATPSDFVRAYPVSREWLTLLIRRMDAVAAVYRLASSLSPGIGGLSSHVEFHRRGRFDAAITLHDGRSFRRGAPGPCPAAAVSLRPAEGHRAVRPRAPSRHRADPCSQRMGAAEDGEVLHQQRSPRLLHRRGVQGVPRETGPSHLVRTHGPVRTLALYTGDGQLPRQPRRRASLPRPERTAQAAATFGVSPSEKRTLDLVTDHPMIPREHLANWLGVSEGRVSQMMHSLVDTWGLVGRRGQRGDVRYTLSAEGIRYVTHRDRAELPTTRGIWSTALTTDKQGRHRHVGHRIETWARQTKHADGITWFLSKLESETRADPHSKLEWSVPTSRSDRTYNWGDSAIAPDAVGRMTAQGLRMPFYFEYELRARHPQGVIARLRPYTRYYHSNEPGEDQPPYPVTLFVVGTEEVEATYVSAASRMTLMTVPILVSCVPVLSHMGILGRSWRPLWEPESPRLALSGLRAYHWDSLYHRMRHRPVGGNR